METGALIALILITGGAAVVLLMMYQTQARRAQALDNERMAFKTKIDKIEKDAADARKQAERRAAEVNDLRDKLAAEKRRSQKVRRATGENIPVKTDGDDLDDWHKERAELKEQLVRAMAAVDAQTAEVERLRAETERLRKGRPEPAAALAGAAPAPVSDDALKAAQAAEVAARIKASELDDKIRKADARVAQAESKAKSLREELGKIQKQLRTANIRAENNQRAYVIAQGQYEASLDRIIQAQKAAHRADRAVAELIKAVGPDTMARIEAAYKEALDKIEAEEIERAAQADREYERELSERDRRMSSQQAPEAAKEAVAAAEVPPDGAAGNATAAATGPNGAAAPAEAVIPGAAAAAAPEAPSPAPSNGAEGAQGPGETTPPGAAKP